MKTGNTAFASIRNLATAASVAMLLAPAATPVFAGDDAEVIYGDDNRLDLYNEANDARMVEAARSTAALVNRDAINIDEADETMTRLSNATFGDANNLCATEPFREQPNPAFCSGFLVGPKTFVTAGHCITNDNDCANTAMVFGFGYQTADKDVTLIPNEDIYHCNAIIAREQAGEEGTDYAVIELDREVTGRTPLTFRTEGMIAVGDDVTVIGHPSGLPTKISGGANVRSVDAALPFFVANLDTYGGNSGSAVFNSTTGMVEGILVRGEQDFVETNGCVVSNVCTNDGCRGEDVTKATEFAPHIPDPNEQAREVRTVDFDSGALTAEIPDSDENGVTTQFEVDATEQIAKVGIHVQLTHSYIGDLHIEIVHPDGTAVTVYDRAGGAAHDMNQTFGLGGTSVSALSTFRNKPASGSWKVIVKDLAASDVGILQNLKLSLEVYTN